MRPHHLAALAVLLIAAVAGPTGCGGTCGAGAPAFTLAVSPSSRMVTQGQSTTYTSTLTAQNGFASTVNLSVSGLPADTTGAFNPPYITPTAGGANSTLTVTTTGTGQGGLEGTIRSRAPTPPGTYTLTVTAAGGGITRTRTVQLVVQ